MVDSSLPLTGYDDSRLFRISSRDETVLAYRRSGVFHGEQLPPRAPGRPSGCAESEAQAVAQGVLQPLYISGEDAGGGEFLEFDQGECALTWSKRSSSVKTRHLRSGSLKLQGNVRIRRSGERNDRSSRIDAPSPLQRRSAGREIDAR
jgi:hypothetical protein